MGFMDKVKAQATTLAEKAQEGAKAGQAKISEMQAKKHADSLLLELGGIVYPSRRAARPRDADTRAAGCRAAAPVRDRARSGDGEPTTAATAVRPVPDRP